MIGLRRCVLNSHAAHASSTHTKPTPSAAVNTRMYLAAERRCC